MTNRPTTQTGATLKKMLLRRHVTQAETAAAMGTTQPYLSQVITGRKLASSAWLDTAVQALGASQSERNRLHRAAARDHGFKIDLTKKT